MKYKDVLLKVAPVSDLVDQRYEIVCLGAKTESALQLKLQAVKRWKQRKWPIDGKEVPCQIVYQNEGKPGDFDHFAGKKVGDFIQKALPFETVK